MIFLFYFICFVFRKKIKEGEYWIILFGMKKIYAWAKQKSFEGTIFPLVFFLLGKWIFFSLFRFSFYFFLSILVFFFLSFFLFLFSVLFLFFIFCFLSLNFYFRKVSTLQSIEIDIMALQLITEEIGSKLESVWMILNCGRNTWEVTCSSSLFFSSFKPRFEN